MPLISVADVLPSIGRKLNGPGVDTLCEPGFSQAMEAYNKISRLLMLEQETFVTAFVTIPLVNNCFTLERRIQRILHARNGCGQIQIVGTGFQFMDAATYERYDGASCFERLNFLGAQFPTMRDLDKPRLIFAVSDRPEEANLLVMGTDENGAELRTHNVGKGITVPIIQAACDRAPEFNCGDDFHRGLVSTISMLRKPRTNGYVQVWGFDEYHGDVYWITTMAPDEESPSLTRYQVNGMCPQSIVAEVSLQYVPLYDLNEVSLIQQQDAYEDMAQALHYYDTGDYNAYQVYRNAALSKVRKKRAREDGMTHKLNVRVGVMPLQGRNFSFRRF
jgi:hypothetical protein